MTSFHEVPDDVAKAAWRKLRERQQLKDML